MWAAFQAPHTAASEHPPALARSTPVLRGGPLATGRDTGAVGVFPDTLQHHLWGLAGLMGLAVTVPQPGRAQLLEKFVRQRENRSKELLNHGQHEWLSWENWGEKGAELRGWKQLVNIDSTNQQW